MPGEVDTDIDTVAAEGAEPQEPTAAALGGGVGEPLTWKEAV